MGFQAVLFTEGTKVCSCHRNKPCPDGHPLTYVLTEADFTGPPPGSTPMPKLSRVSEKLKLQPWTLKRADALAFVREHHRHLPDVQGAMWCIAVRRGDQIVGVALVGWPSRTQTTDEIDHLRVLRVAVKPGNPNACSMLLGACWRAARAMGATSMDTFTMLDEPGTSLRAAGWIEAGLTAGGEHSRKGRPRKKAVDSRPKRRWWAPGSRKIPGGE